MSDTIKIAVNLPVKCLHDIMTTAVEGGINYWCDGAESIERAEDLSVTRIVFKRSYDGSKCKHQTIEARQIARGIELMFADPSKYSHIIKDTFDMFDAEGCGADANSADIILQLAVFGEVVFG